MTLRHFEPDDFAPLPLMVPAPPESTAETLQEKFEEFDALNPWVYQRLVQMTGDLVARGRTRVGMKMLFEVLRWQYAMTTNDPHSDFKLNNNYHSRYARKIMEDRREWGGVFETRALTS